MKKEVIKPSNLIHICHKLNLIEQQLFNFLLAEAQETLRTNYYHAISIAKITHYLGSKRSKNTLKLIIQKLNIMISYTVINKEETPIVGQFRLFNSITIVDDICHYRFSHEIHHLLTQTKMFARINLVEQNKLKSKYSHVLYELFADYVTFGKTPMLSIEKLKNYLGLESESYSDFKTLHYAIIKKSIKEIELATSIRIKENYKRNGKEIIAIQFMLSSATEKPIQVKPAIQVEPIKAVIPRAKILEFDIEAERLQREHNQYVEDLAVELYKSLSQEQVDAIENKFQSWIKSNPIASIMANVIKTSRKHFFIQEIVPVEEKDFRIWAAKKGYLVEKFNQSYKIISKSL